MKYIKQNQNVMMEYEVLIDVEKLESIIKELNEKCSYVIKKNARVTSSSIEEALEKITLDKSTINFTKIFDVLDLGSDFEFLKSFTKPQFVFEYEFDYRQPPYLSYLLTTILKSYNSDVDMTVLLDNLLNYEESDEINSYKEKMSEEGITEELYSKYELLCGLYQAARECIKTKLISEVIHYNDNDDKGKVLGK